MRIDIDTAELLYDIQSTSHLEAGAITDAEARYRVEAGTEKEEELKRDILYAASTARQIMSRFLADDFISAGNNTMPQTLPTKIQFNFEVSSRRLDGKIHILTDILHTFLVDAALAEFYATVNEATLTANHMAKVTELTQKIEQIIYTKKPPRV